MSEKDAATKPAEAETAQPLTNENPHPSAEDAQSVQVESEPAQVTSETLGAEPTETELVPAEETPKHEQSCQDASAEKPVVGENDAEGTEAEPDTQSGKSRMLKTTAKIDHENIHNNRKFDPSVREVTDDPIAIRKQVEFYFGDWNFPQDKFMWETCEGTANKPIAISKIHSFKRMRSFQPYSAVVAALRDSKVLDVAGEDGEETVKRKVPYKPMAEGRAKVEASTVYVKGFGDENPDTQFDLESFFAKFGEIKGLRLRRTNEGLFKGSVFVTFPDKEAAKKFIQMNPAPTYKDHELKIMSKRDYCEEKSELIRQGKLEPNNTSHKKFFEGRDPNRKRGRGNHRRGREGDDWKARRELDQKTGFQDWRGGGRGRWGRGHGRGRGFGRGGREGDGRDRDSRQDGAELRKDVGDGMPRIQSTTGEDEGTAAAGRGKRVRDEDGGEDGAPVAKKVDTKQDMTAEAT